MLLFGFKFHLFYQILILWGGTFSEDRDLTTNSLVLATTNSELHDSKICKSDSVNDAPTENKHVLENDDKNARHDQKETYFEEVSVQKHFPPQVNVKDVNEATTSPEQQEAIKVPVAMVFFFVTVSFLCMLPFLYKFVIFLWRKCKICIAKLNEDTSQDNRSRNTIEMDTISNSSDQFIRNIPQPRFNSSSGKNVSESSDSSNNQSENPQEMDNTSNSSDQFTSNIPKSVLDKFLSKEDTPISSKFLKSHTYI